MCLPKELLLRRQTGWEIPVVSQTQAILGVVTIVA